MSTCKVKSCQYNFLEEWRHFTNVRSNIIDIVEILQYTIIYFIGCLFIAPKIDSWIGSLSYGRDSYWSNFFWVLLELTITIVVLNYLQLAIHLIPPLVDSTNVGTGAGNRATEVVIAMCFTGMQQNLRDKVKALAVDDNNED